MSRRRSFSTGGRHKAELLRRDEEVVCRSADFSGPIEDLPKNVQQAANAALLHYMTREMLGAYWEISNPSPNADSSLDALLAENEQKVIDRFTKRETL